MLRMSSKENSGDARIQRVRQCVSTILVFLAICLNGCLSPAPRAKPLTGIPLPVVAPRPISPPTAPQPLPLSHAVVMPRWEPAHRADGEETVRLQQNALFGRFLQTRLKVDLKAHVVLPAGLDVFVYSEPEMDVTVDRAALADVLAGRLSFLDTLTDPRYQAIFTDAKRRLDQHQFQGYSLHVILSGNPQSCIVYADAQTPQYRPVIVTYPDDPSTRQCQAVGYAINNPYTTVYPQTPHPITKRTIAGVILTPTADASGRYRNTEQPSKLRVELPASEVYGFTIGHEFLHACVGYFDDNPVLNNYNEERQIQLLDRAYYQVYAGLVSKPLPFQVARHAAAAQP